jgi:murein DD-endopeptidase MepM/ murein hydrolase activator NlpD
MISYWNKTYYVDIKTKKDLIYRYAELKNTNFQKGDYVEKNDLVGLVGQVLNFSMINDESPKYIKQLKDNNKCSMLHFEVYKKMSLFDDEKYMGGNWFGLKKPDCLMDPVYHI